MICARSIMSEELVTVQPDCSIQEAIEKLLEHGISGLPVINDSGALVGIVTEFALLGLDLR